MQRALSGESNGVLSRYGGRLVFVVLCGVALVTSWGTPGWMWIARLVGQ
jgi:hypothetical protein